MPAGHAVGHDRAALPDVETVWRPKVGFPQSGEFITATSGSCRPSLRILAILTPRRACSNRQDPGQNWPGSCVCSAHECGAGGSRLKCFVGEGPSLDQITFEMFHIPKVSFCQKCDFWQNPRHVVARGTLVQR